MRQSTVIDGVDYGPLACLVGNWQGDKGMDVAPEPDGEEHSPYFETIIFEACGSVDNAGSQVLAVLRYHQLVSRISTGEVFHNESGYYSWDASSDVISQSFVIPRAVAVVAGGKGERRANGSRIGVSAALGDPDWGIVQSPFMRDNASTKSFFHELTVSGDELRYSETTVVDIYGRTFEHSDENTLNRV